jgi:hypothetical protein
MYQRAFDPDRDFRRRTWGARRWRSRGPPRLPGWSRRASIAGAKPAATKLREQFDANCATLIWLRNTCLAPGGDERLRINSMLPPSASAWGRGTRLRHASAEQPAPVACLALLRHRAVDALSNSLNFSQRQSRKSLRPRTRRGETELSRDRPQDREA